jgi:sugar lactone lactonase YvrE
VTVQTQPANEHCSLTNSTGTIAGANVSNVAVACAAMAHTLGGTITGLPSAGLVLANGTDTVSPAAGASTFTFANQVAEGGAYAVSVQAQPTGATCSVGSGTGTVGTTDVATVQVTCAANAYHVSGTISGLTTSGLVLANGTDTVSPAANATTFALTGAVAFGGTYSVTVRQQPTGTTCVVGGTYPATIGAGDVTDIAVTCNAATQFTLLAGRETCPTPRDVDGTGAAASIGNLVTGLAYDAAGNLYVGTAYQTLRKITPAGVVTTLAGQYGSSSTGAATPVDGTGAAAVFGDMQGIATDSAGNIFVIDGNEIRKVTQGGVVTTIAGSTASGSAEGTGTAASFAGPAALVVDPTGTVYIADTLNNKIRKMTPAGVVSTLAGSGLLAYQDGTGTAAAFRFPQGIALDAAGNLLVVDSGNNVIRKVTTAGVVTTFVGNPAAGGFADGTGAAAEFGQPKEGSLDGAGDLFVSDNNRVAIRKITPAGVVTTVAVTGHFTTQTGQQPPTGAVQLPALPSNTYYITNSAGVVVVPVNCAIETIGP